MSKYGVLIFEVLWFFSKVFYTFVDTIYKISDVMKLYIFTLLLLSVLPTLAQQQDAAQDREVLRAERAALLG